VDRISDYDFALPEELIAQTPAERRDASRLLVVGDGLEHRQFRELPSVLPPGALLVVNDTRVLAARLWTRRETGGRVEVVLLQPEAEGNVWRALVRGKLALGTPLLVGDARLRFLGRLDDGTARVEIPGDAVALCEAHGEMPLPPYISRPAPVAADRERYQTVFARAVGAVAAPTAGLHFTDEVLAALAARGIERVPLTLHVGLGTFAPVREERLDDHAMHEERYDLPAATAEAIGRARAEGRPVVAVGTTVVRALESAWQGEGVRPGPGATRIFLRPGHRFRAFDRLLTNFHMPRSTLLVLVSAFAGRERVLDAYRAAVAARYRFFSYGDAMLLSPS
jgi:S-adenosylmethionine:tRNA ribosyltransferase-isomerase